MTVSSPIHLLADGALVLELDESCVNAAARWIPRFRSSNSPTPASAAPATIRVLPGTASLRPVAAGKPSLLLSSVSAWIDDDSGLVRLQGGRSDAHGRIDLKARRAALTVPPHETEERDDNVFTMLTIAGALLLGRLRRTLIHAAGAVDPDGGCWLLIGDTHAGKTTTTINLVRGGWGFLSDDHVVASEEADGLWIEGWPRPFHVDAGWGEGRIEGVRTAVEPGVFGADRWARKAPLAGLLFPQVTADRPTRLAPLAPATSLTLLIRQTPWLLADRGTGEDLLALLGRMAGLPAFRLSVGRDSYADSSVLIQRFEEARKGSSQP